MSRREVWLITVVCCCSLLGAAWLVRTPRTSLPAHPPVAQTDPFAGVRAAMKQAQAADARTVSHAWRDFAWVVERDQRLKTTGELRAAIARFEELLWAKTNLAGAFPGFSAAANEGLAQTLGREDAPLDRAAAVAVLRSLAAACEVTP